MSYEEVMDVVLPRQRQQTPHITGHYGERRASGPHGGFDFNYEGGQTEINLTHPTVHSPVAGVVTFVGGEFGTIKIRDAEGNSHEILHTDTQSATPGQTVIAGEAIGTMGGRDPHGATQYAQHVHYQMKDSQGHAINPETYWNERSLSLPSPMQPTAAPTHLHSPSSHLLEQSSLGTAVQSLQRQLTELGYTDAHGKSLQTDGHFGPNTRYALEAFQRDHNLTADGMVGPRTQHVLDEAIQQRTAGLEANSPPKLTESTHEAYPIYRQCLSGVGGINASHGIAPSERDKCIAAALTVEATAQGLSRVDHVRLSDDASRIFAVQGKPQSIDQRFASVDTLAAIHMPLEQSSALWPLAVQQGLRHQSAVTELHQQAMSAIDQTTALSR